MVESPEPARQTGHKWQPIEDLPADWVTMCEDGLSSLLNVWSHQRKKLEGTEALEDFQARMVRSWSIETGILEHIYTLDEGVTLTLVERGFDAALIDHGDTDLPPDELIAILEDHREVAEGLFAFIKRQRPLSQSYIRELHQVIARHQDFVDAIDTLGNAVRVPLKKGTYKTLPNNPGTPGIADVRHEYCPPEHVESEMQRLVELHVDHADVPFEIEAAWLHHRFTQIHPFQDGNGRVARALATLVCLRAGAFPLVVDRRDKPDYIKALEDADQGNLKPLVSLFRRQQREAFIKALSLSEQAIERQASLNAIIADAGRRLEKALFHKADALAAHANHLNTLATGKCQEIAASLRESLGPRVGGFDARVFSSRETNTHYFSGQIIETAKRLEYFANLSGPRWWTRLRITHETVSDLIVSLHHLGRVADGVMVGTAFLSQKDPRSGDVDGPKGLPYHVEPVCDGLFTFTAGQDQADLENAFLEWLERALKIGLDAWRRSL